MQSAPDVIDPHRPWIRDQRDDPAEMNWTQTLFNPMGMSSKLHFSRAWTFMFLGRVLLFIGPVFAAFLAGLAGADTSGLWKPVSFLVLPIPELLVPFFIFTIVTELTSWVAHVRRFAEANRSTLLAMIVLIPLFLGLAGFALGAMGGSKQFAAMQAESKPAVAEKTIVLDDGSATTVVENADGTETASTNTASAAKEEVKAEDKPDAKKAKKQQGGGGHGPPGPPPTERQMAIGAGMSLALIPWSIASLIVMFWTLLYVARMPNGGVGPFKTGSDVAQGEEQTFPGYAVS